MPSARNFVRLIDGCIEANEKLMSLNVGEADIGATLHVTEVAASCSGHCSVLLNGIYAAKVPLETMVVQRRLTSSAVPTPRSRTIAWLNGRT